MTYLQRLIAALLNKQPPAPVVVAPVPEPIATEPQRILTGAPLDTRNWEADQSGWTWDDQAISYTGTQQSILRSPRMQLPADRRIKLEATITPTPMDPV